MTDTNELDTKILLKELKLICNEVGGLKITKNTKGYNWEFKIVGEVTNDMIVKSKLLDDALIERYGPETE